MTVLEINLCDCSCHQALALLVSPQQTNRFIAYLLLQMRAAILEEIRLAAQVLTLDNHFSSGAAAAVGCYIRTFLTGVEGFAGPVLLDHARLLDVEPLKGLLEFLWLLMGLKRHCLTPVIQANELMGVRSPCWQAFIIDIQRAGATTAVHPWKYVYLAQYIACHATNFT